MKKTLRIMSLVLALVICLGMLAGCSSDASSAPASQAGSEAAGVAKTDLVVVMPEDLETFAKLSQLYQAEALKTMMEHCRSNPDCNGLIWWNMLDCWPQISDAVVDYYFTKKLAYDYIKNSQQPLCLMFDEPNEENRITLYAANEIPAARPSTKVELPLS